jgi:hypothetical protein
MMVADEPAAAIHQGQANQILFFQYVVVFKENCNFLEKPLQIAVENSRAFGRRCGAG